MKECSALCFGISVADRSESSRYSAMTFDGMMYATERLIKVGFPVIIEALTFKCKGDTRVLYERFVERAKTPERGDANVLHGAVSYADFKLWCENLATFTVGGERIEIDTTNFDVVDFHKHICFARRFVNNGFQ